MSSDYRSRKGLPNLSEAVKVGVLQQKKLQMFTQDRIATTFGISRKTVNKLSEDDLSPEGQLLMQDFTEQLSEIRTKTANLIIEKLDNKTIKDGVLPTLLNIANQNYRLETNQPTQIVNDESTNRLANITQSIIERKRLEYAQNNLPVPSIDDVLTSLEDALKANNVSRESVKALLDKQAAESEQLSDNHLDMS